MRSRKLTCASINFIGVLLSQSVHSQLQVEFYGNSCSLAEFIVKDEVRNSFFRDQGVAAGLVRLHFYDCFARVSKRAKLPVLVALVSGLAPIGSFPFHLKYIGESQYFTIKI